MTMEATTWEDLRDDAFTCRLLGHAWYTASASELSELRGRTNMIVKCDRCTSERRDVVNNRTGEVEGRKYVYVDGYQINETVVRSQLRSEWTKRQATKRISRSN